MSPGVTRPIRTVVIVPWANGQEDARETAGRKDAQLLNQLDAVDRDTPLLRTESGNTSLGRTHPIGP